MPNRMAQYGPNTEDFPTNTNGGLLRRNAAGNGWEYVVFSGAPSDVGSAAASGSADTIARGDHVHDLPESVLRSVFAEITAALNANAQRLTNLAAPTDGADAATKTYVDAAAAGARDPKDSCRLATAAAPAAYTRAANVITFSAVGSQSVDGVATALNDRILLRNGAAGADNGIYSVTTKGTGAVAEVWTRTTDADTDAEVTAGMFTWATEGTANADSGWLLTTDDPITLNTTALTFTQVSGLGQITAGAGMTKTGNTIDVVAAANGSITVNADSIETTFGLVGAMVTQDAAGVSVGTQGSSSRTDHKHAYDMGLVGDVAAIGTANAAGTSNRFARPDHVHAHGDQTSATLHAAVTQSANGFMVAADKKKVDDVLESTTTATATTTDATVTTVGTIATSDNTTIIVEAWVATRRTDVAGTGAGYKMTATARRGVGAASLVQIGSTSIVSQHEDAAALDATLDVDTTAGTVRCRVTGIAAQTFNWRSRMIATSV